MSKELEALRNFISECENDWKTQPKRWVDCAINSNVSKYMDSLKSILTPPTAEEVCKALSEYDDFDEVNYRVSTRGFYSNDTICYLGIDYQEKPIIIFEYDLPPHLITLIGRFYEGEEDE